jgi:hypothetical protein
MTRSAKAALSSKDKSLGILWAKLSHVSASPYADATTSLPNDAFWVAGALLHATHITAIIHPTKGRACFIF